MNIIKISGLPGTGLTESIINMALHYAQSGYKCVIWNDEHDIQRFIPSLTPHTTLENLYVIPVDPKLSKLQSIMDRLEEYDVNEVLVFIDAPSYTERFLSGKYTPISNLLKEFNRIWMTERINC